MWLSSGGLFVNICQPVQAQVAFKTNNQELPHIQNGTTTRCTHRREELVVIFLAVWETVALEEVLRAQFHGAVRALEVLRMPNLPKCGDHLQTDVMHFSFSGNCLLPEFCNTISRTITVLPDQQSAWNMRHSFLWGQSSHPACSCHRSGFPTCCPAFQHLSVKQFFNWYRCIYLGSIHRIIHVASSNHGTTST